MRWLRKFNWQWVIEPDSSIQDPVERRRIRFYAATLLGMIVLLLPALLIRHETAAPQIMFGVLIGLLGTAYGLSRTRYYRLGVYTGLFLLSGFTLLSVLFTAVTSRQDVAVHLMWLILPLVLASIMLPRRQFAIATTIVIGSVFLLPIWLKSLSLIQLLPFLAYIFAWGTAHFILLWQMDLMEWDRQVRLKETAEQLAQTNQALQTEINERKLAEAKIEASLQEKEALLKEIHHRVKNNLQIISSLLNLQSAQVDNEQWLAAFDDSQRRIRSMALIHEKLYRSHDLARVNFADYVHSLAAYLLQSYHSSRGTVELAITAEPVSLGIDTAVPCGLILNELISNALKHAFPEGRTGKIYIEIAQTSDDEINMCVRDDGVGLPPDIDQIKTASLGLQLIYTLAQQVNGRLQIANEDGAAFHLTFQTAVSEPIPQKSLPLLDPEI